MSLLSEQMTTCYIMDKTTEPDGYGGVITTWKEGAEIEAAISYDTSMQARLAEKQGVTSLYTIVTKKSVKFRFHDIIKRASDGVIFRITSNGDDNKTPESAGLNMRVVSAELMEAIR